jgi:hypothetical protein
MRSDGVGKSANGVGGASGLVIAVDPNRSEVVAESCLHERTRPRVKRHPENDSTSWTPLWEQHCYARSVAATLLFVRGRRLMASFAHKATKVSGRHRSAHGAASGSDRSMFMPSPCRQDSWPALILVATYYRRIPTGGGDGAAWVDRR